MTAWRSAVAGRMAERVVDDLEVVQVDEQDRAHYLLRARQCGEDAFQADLEHAAIGRAGEGVALGEILHVAQEDRVAQVERGDRAGLAEDGQQAPIDTADRGRRMLDHDGPDRTAVGDHRGDQDVARPGHRLGEDRVERGLELAHREDLPALPGPGDDGVRAEGDGRHVVDADGGQDDHLVVGRADDDAALEAEALGEPVEDGDRLADRIGHVVEPGADIDDRLEVGTTVAKLPLVHGREHRRRQGEQPERHDVEQGHPLELDRGAADDIDSRDELGGLRVQHDEQEERVPQRELQPGSI